MMNASAQQYPPKQSISANRAMVLTKAVARAADRLGVTRSQLSLVLGLSQSTISRVYKGEYLLDDRRKEWERALSFVRVFRSLDAIVGQELIAQQWLQSHNHAFNARPIELIGTAEGLVRVAQYLDANSHQHSH
jgi:uncharacterized protein (DUF2384 family)